MKTLTGNQKAGSAGAALAVFLSVGSLHGCAYETDFVQINDGATATTDRNVTLTIHAENGKGVYSYFVTEMAATESPATPAAGATWQSIANASTVFDADVPLALADALGTRTVYVWFKDAQGNISDPVSDTITYGSTGQSETPGY
jgi:hypothetical protein